MKGIKRRIRNNKWLRWGLIITNWLLQGIWNADKTEKIYRVSFSIVLFIITFFLFERFSEKSTFFHLIISFIISHSFNWIVNGNFYNLLIHRLMIVKLSKDGLFDYIIDFQKRIENKNWILLAAAFGSICKGTIKDSSDLDISIVRKPGLQNAFVAILFSVKEKKLADTKRIPLELYINDSIKKSLKRFSNEKQPLVLYDPDGIAKTIFTQTISMEEARKINALK